MVGIASKVTDVVSPQSTTFPNHRQPDGGQVTGTELTFSRHLTERINRRGLDLSGDKLDRLSQAINKVADKGARDSVVFLDDLALLVNVKNRVVLTAMKTAKMKEGVFTNIDSVVVG